MKTVIIDYGSGNLRSAEKSALRAAKEAGLDQEILVTSNVDDVMSADRIILPGVGAFADCMSGLSKLDGMRQTLEEKVIQSGTPFLGICVGMQLLANVGREHGQTDGLGWIDGAVEEINLPENSPLKIPHMGWNDLNVKDNDHPVLNGINSGDHAYFVHSFHFKTGNNRHILMDVDYGQNITAMIGKDNIVGTQFHPEKSQELGLKLLGNFLTWAP